MTTDSNPHWIYNQTIKLFAAGAEPPFEVRASWRGPGARSGASTTTWAASARS